MTISSRILAKLVSGAVVVSWFAMGIDAVAQEDKVVGMTSSHPAYVFNNSGVPCIHADPLIGDIAPGETAEAISVIHIFKGSLDDFGKRCVKSGP
jgi:hypothetical protein